MRSLNVRLMSSARSSRTEKGCKRVVSAGITTGSGGPEVETTADGDVGGIANVGVALRSATARHGRPSDRIERRKIKTEHVARSDADELRSLKNDLVEPQLGRLDVRLSDQRVGGLNSVERRVGRERRGRSPDLEEDAVFDGDDLGVDLPAGDDAVRQDRVGRFTDDDCTASGVFVRSQRHS